jgi:hypothetical protein
MSASATRQAKPAAFYKRFALVTQVPYLNRVSSYL